MFCVYFPLQLNNLTGSHLLVMGNIISKYRGPGIPVGIATDYGLDGPESNPDGDETSRQSRPALEPTQPPIRWVPGLSRG